MRIEPLVVILPRCYITEEGQNLLSVRAKLVTEGQRVADWPDFIRVNVMSFAKPTHPSETARAIDYTCGSVTLRVYRG